MIAQQSGPVRVNHFSDESITAFRSAEPFNHLVIDDFLTPETADAIAAEFPAFDGPVWNEYNNAIEIKKACNHWDRFPKATYNLFKYLNSPEFVAQMSALAGDQLQAD